MKFSHIVKFFITLYLLSAAVMFYFLINVGAKEIPHSVVIVFAFSGVCSAISVVLEGKK